MMKSHFAVIKKTDVISFIIYLIKMLREDFLCENNAAYNSIFCETDFLLKSRREIKL